MGRLKVLMIGPSRKTKGGMTTVVNNYFAYGLDNNVELKYIETINDKNKILKFLKEIKGKIEFLCNIKKFDIVHIHMASRRSTFRKIKYIKIAKKYNKKIVLHIHGGGFKRFYNDECNDIEKKYIVDNLNKCDSIIVLSEEWKEYFENIISTKKIKVLYNGVEIPENFDKKLMNKDILYLGRIEKEKGIYEMLKAISILKENYKDIKLYIGGAGEDSLVRSTIEKYGIENNVELLGWINNYEKEKYLRNCTYFILPSYFEAMPMAILEAMAYKCVVIATNVGGIPQVIDNNKNGILIDKENVDSIVASFELLFKNDTKRKKMSEASYKSVEKKFDVKKNIDSVLSIYYEINKI